MSRTEKRHSPKIAKGVVAAAFASGALLFQIDGGAIVSPAVAQTSGAQGQWMPTGSLNVPRRGHTATLLGDGRVLVIGGASLESVESSAELYDPVRGTWQMTNSMHFQRYGHSATLLLDGRVLVVGGVQQARINSAEIFDPVSGAWKPTGPMVSGRFGHSSTLLANGSVLVAGGLRRDSTKSATNGAEIFDPAAGTWGLTGAIVKPRREHAAMRLPNGDVLVLGGWTYDVDRLIGDLNPFVGAGTERYNATTQSWTVELGDKHDYIQGRAALALPDGKVALVGGYLGDFYFGSTIDDWGVTRSSVGIVDLLSPDGSTLVDAEILLNVPRQGMTATALPTGEILVVGGLMGKVNDRPLESVTADVALAETISVAGAGGSGGYGTIQTSTLIAARHGHTATLLHNGSVLVVGGATLAPDGEYAGETSIREKALSSVELFRASPAGTIGPGYTGAWFDPAQSGHGLFVEVLPDNQLLAAWFTFNPAGTQQAWFVGVGTYSGNTATVTSVIQPTGGRWIPNFNPAQVTNNTWGSLTFTFTDCNHGKVDFVSTLGYGVGTMNLTRLTLPAGLTCPIN